MSYQQSKIRQLLNHFSLEQFCMMVYDEPLGRPLYERLRPGTLGQLPHWLLTESRYYAPLLRWVKRNHPTRYRQYAPYAENPFHVGSGYLHEASAFYGRQRLLREVKGALQQYQNVAILSQSRRGSSSFLYHLVATKATYQTKQALKTRKIIKPSRRVRPKRHKVDPQKWEQALLAMSAWTEEEIQEIEKAREYINQWQPRQFA